MSTARFDRLRGTVMSTRDSALRTVDLRNLSLPPLWCPIPSGLHPQVDRIEADAIAWIDQAGLHDNDTERARIIATRAAEFYARLAPDADPDRLLVAVLWIYLFSVRATAGPPPGR